MSRYIAFLVLLAVVYLLGSIDCHQINCPPNEVFKSCGTACEPTCNVPQPEICIQMCIVNVCQCIEGYVRNSAKQCIKPNEC
ncbi:chymotrypsin inhibitor-like [Ceratina calcarata]|uniref:Chymotrypsin inhibitor-like n=1 Tax=Ceratina calcarata TaxID=156304 RepID=A0AAJ7NDQ8_9HYME|nr:chymotrypsin inhibitor-like [Ceratina calcarata]